MNKGIVAAVAAAALFASAAAARADDMNWNSPGGFYLRLDSGWSFSRDAGGDFDTDVGNSYVVGGGAGYRFNDYLRADVTIGYRGGYDIDASQSVSGSTFAVNGDVSSLTGMVNAYVDVAKFGMFRPYVGGGIGVSRNKVSNLSASYLGVTGSVNDHSETSFAWQASAGVGVEVAPNVTVDVGYRYVDLGSMKTGDTVTIGGTSFGGAGSSDGDLRAHELQIGLRYNF